MATKVAPKFPADPTNPRNEYAGVTGTETRFEVWYFDNATGEYDSNGGAGQFRERANAERYRRAHPERGTTSLVVEVANVVGQSCEDDVEARA